MANWTQTESGTLVSPQAGSDVEAPPAGQGTELRGRFRYRLMKRLGKGAFGSVHLARCLDHDPRRDDSPAERVAIKILSGARGPGLGMLKRELSAMLKIQHDRIPRIYDWALDEPYAFVAMEYYPSGSLRDLMPLQVSVEEPEVWRLLADLLSALVVAHRKSILHLDIKPANVLLDGTGGYVLTDFGVSQASRMGRGLLPMSIGTPGYQAPEQKRERFEQYDLRTDLWGVGATAWAFATGTNLAERDQQQGEDGAALPPLRTLRPDLSEDLEGLIGRLLAESPARRPGSAAEVLAQAAAHVSGSAFESATLAAARRSNVDEAEVTQVVEALVDPLVLAICRQQGFRRHIARWDDGEALCVEGEPSYYAYLLLHGTVLVSKRGRELTRVDGEGKFLGEIATLVGNPRTASMHASGTVYACVLNAAELERFVTCNPAMGLRVIRSMALRLSRAPGKRSDAAEDDFLERMRER